MAKDRKYHYRFENVKRACGHVDAVVEYKTQMAYEPRALEWAVNEECFDCRKKRAQARQAATDKAEAWGRKWVAEHGVDPKNVSYIQSENEGKQVTVALWFKVE